MDIRVTGANQLSDVAKALKDAGQKDLKRQMVKGLRAGAEPLADEARLSAVANLPRKGGLNQLVAASRFGVAVRSAGRNPSVRITVKDVAGRVTDIASTDKGRLRHPVFADQRKTRADWTWVSQSILPGWFSVPMSHGARRVRPELLKVMEDVVNKIARST